MKTIVFSTDSNLIENYQKQGEVIIAKDPIKTLKAMKQIASKEEYRVVGDMPYTEVAQKLGYSLLEEPAKEEPKTAEEPKEPSIQVISKLTESFEQQLKEQEKEYEAKLLKVRGDYEEKIREYEDKLGKAEKEKNQIKKVVKKIVYDNQ